MQKRTGVLLPAIFNFCIRIAPAQGNDLDAYVRQEMTTRKIPGLAFALVDHGKVITKRAYGSENLETGTPLGADGVFELASVAKPFTATAIMMLVEKCKMGLDDPILKYIPDGPNAWKDITVRQLLSHTSGLRGEGWVECDGSPLLYISKRRYFDDIAKAPLEFPPGEGGAYSDAGYFLLGMIIEKVSGMSYRRFMQERVFLPFGMTSSRIEDRRAIVKNHVSEYTLVNGQLEQERRVWQHELPSYYGVWSTVDDLVKWNTALEEGRVVKPQTLALMWTPTKLKNGNVAKVDNIPYGLGWFVFDIAGHRVVAHPGFLGWAMFRYVDLHLTLILLTNRDVEGGSFQVAIGQGIMTRIRADIPFFFNQ